MADNQLDLERHGTRVRRLMGLAAAVLGFSALAGGNVAIESLVGPPQPEYLS